MYTKLFFINDSFIHPSIHLHVSIYPPVHLFIYLSIYIYMYLSIHPFIYLFIHLSLQKTVNSKITLWVSADRKPFKQAKIPSTEGHQAYLVDSIKSVQALVIVQHDSGQFNLYMSEEMGVLYTLALPDIVVDTSGGNYIVDLELVCIHVHVYLYVVYYLCVCLYCLLIIDCLLFSCILFVVVYYSFVYFILL